MHVPFNNIKENISLKPFNSFAVDHHAKYFCQFKTIAELIEYITWAQQQQIKTLTLGNGSNILFTKNFDGLVLKNAINFITPIEETNEYIILKVGSGCIWDDFIAYAVKNNYYGIENLSLIPSTVGATPIQNIGAYGVEVSEVIDQVEYLDLTDKQIKIISKTECIFKYRESIFKNTLKYQAIITAVFFKLYKNATFNLDYPDLKNTFKNKKSITLNQVRNKIIEIRTNKLPNPKILANAGSFFKNPIIPIVQFQTLQQQFNDIISFKISDTEIKIPAAWLIEKCGWKGKQIGQVTTHKQHALILINLGNANGNDILEYAQQIQNDILQKFNISLEIEVNVE